MNIKLVSLIFVIFLSSICVAQPGDMLCIRDYCFDLEIMRTDEELSRGMQKRTMITDNFAMLFVFDYDAPHAFWMKDTLIPLDMIWIDSKFMITEIKRSVQPCVTLQCPVFKPGGNARFVMEIRGGLADEIGIKAGDMVSFGVEQIEGQN